MTAPPAFHTAYKSAAFNSRCELLAFPAFIVMAEVRQRAPLLGSVVVGIFGAMQMEAVDFTR